MALFGLGHAADLARRAPAPEHRELALIDPRRAELAGVIDPQHPLDLRRWRRIAGQRVSRWFAHASVRPAPPRPFARRRRAVTKQMPVIASEARRFQPASETPRTVQAGSSQRTGCW